MLVAVAILESSMLVDAKALYVLPDEMQDYIIRDLRCQLGVINGFGWDAIKAWWPPTGVQCVKLCSYSSPSKDCQYIWVYNNHAHVYELYYTTPYSHPTEYFCSAVAGDSHGPLQSTESLSSLLGLISNSNNVELCALKEAYFSSDTSHINNS
jgi:hypothetical protein